MNKYAKWFVVIVGFILAAESVRSGWGQPGFGNGLMAMGLFNTAMYYLDK